MRQWIRSVLPIALSSAVGGCSGWQSALDPRGSQSDAIRHIFYVFLAVAAVVWIAVMVFLLVGLRRRARAAAGPLDLHPPFERRAGFIIFLLGIGTTVVVLALSIVSYAGQHVVFGKGADINGGGKCAIRTTAQVGRSSPLTRSACRSASR
jgi:cytochrome c oxidase subunit II